MLSDSEPRTERVTRLIEEQRERHERKGHTWSSVAGYCSEPNGVTAVFCYDGVYLEALDVARAEAARQTLEEVAERVRGLPPRSFVMEGPDDDDREWMVTKSAVLALLSTKEEGA